MPRKSVASTATTTSDEAKVKYVSNRARINSLWKRKKGLLKKAFNLSQCCDQDVFIAIYDPKLKRLTQFETSSDFTTEHIAALKKSKTAKCKLVTGESLQKDLPSKDKHSMKFSSQTSSEERSQSGDTGSPSQKSLPLTVVTSGTDGKPKACSVEGGVAAASAPSGSLEDDSWLQTDEQRNRVGSFDAVRKGEDKVGMKLSTEFAGPQSGDDNWEQSPMKSQILCQAQPYDNGVMYPIQPIDLKQMPFSDLAKQPTMCGSTIFQQTESSGPAEFLNDRNILPMLPQMQFQMGQTVEKYASVVLPTQPLLESYTKAITEQDLSWASVFKAYEPRENSILRD